MVEVTGLLGFSRNLGMIFFSMTKGLIVYFSDGSGGEQLLTHAECLKVSAMLRDMLYAVCRLVRDLMHISGTLVGHLLDTFLARFG